MKTRKSFVLALLVASLFLQGCFMPPMPTNETVAFRGPKPDFTEAMKLVHARLKRTLKDYDSIKDFAVLHGGIYPVTASVAGHNFVEAWMLCVEFNSKNNYGAYDGLREYGFPMMVNSDGNPELISTTGWRTRGGGEC